MSELIDLGANWQAIKDVLQLKYLDGGGYGCNYPDDRFSMIRRWLHHCVFYGFLFCFASTTIAAIYDQFLHLSAPYPILSWPVMLGTVGGLALMAGPVMARSSPRSNSGFPHQSAGASNSKNPCIFFSSLIPMALA